MNQLANRIAFVKQTKGWNNSELARNAGVSRAAPTEWLSGKVKVLSAEVAIRLSRSSGFRASWLATGEGSMMENRANVSPSHVGDRKIPLLNYVQAGRLTDIADNLPVIDADSWLLTDLELSRNAFALEIKGDSMLPEFQEGDRIIVDPEIVPSPGDYVVAINGENEATFKKYRLRGIDSNGNHIFELIPLNEYYPRLRSDMEHLMIVGVMVEHRRYRKR